ncbi:MAG TPA: hypothetical protein DIS85_03720 [Vagococcus sp.]|nr:hypothetical protein [Vagococcus sp.]
MKTAFNSKQLEELLNSPCTWDFLIIVKLPKELPFESQLKKGDENGVAVVIATKKDFLLKLLSEKFFFVCKISIMFSMV